MDFQEYGYFDSEIVGYDEEGFPILELRNINSIFLSMWFSLAITAVILRYCDGALSSVIYAGFGL